MFKTYTYYTTSTCVHNFSCPLFASRNNVPSEVKVWRCLCHLMVAFEALPVADHDCVIDSLLQSRFRPPFWRPIQHTSLSQTNALASKDILRSRTVSRHIFNPIHAKRVGVGREEQGITHTTNRGTAADWRNQPWQPLRLPLAVWGGVGNCLAWNPHPTYCVHGQVPYPKWSRLPTGRFDGNRTEWTARIETNWILERDMWTDG